MHGEQIRHEGGDRQRGLKCQACGSRRFRVVYTRPAHDAKIIRSRKCRGCGRRIITWERAVGIDG
jgi:transcriptional regulator NrdR family protein